METEPDGNFVKMKEYIISLENALHEKESEIDSINKKLYLIENEKISLITNMQSDMHHLVLQIRTPVK